MDLTNNDSSSSSIESSGSEESDWESISESGTIDATPTGDLDEDLHDDDDINWETAGGSYNDNNYNWVRRGGD